MSLPSGSDCAPVRSASAATVFGPSCSRMVATPRLAAANTAWDT